MAQPNHCIALVGDRGVGKTTFLYLNKGNPIRPIKNNKYHATIGSEVHPIVHRGHIFDIYDMGKFSSFNNMPHIQAAIFITKKENPELPVLPGDPPMVMINNKNYRMTREDTYRALDLIAETIH
jgi:hypothetical protein